MHYKMKSCVILAAAVSLLLDPFAVADAADVAGKLRVQPAFFLGGGSGSVDVGSSDKGDPISISGGGGAGFGLTLGYGLSPRVDLDFTYGYQLSSLSPPVANATGTFSRTFYLAGLVYRIPVSERNVVKVGGGMGLYKPGNLDIDASEVPNGFHDVVSYKRAIGSHILADFEVFLRETLSLSFGAKYYSVTYKESSGTRDGAVGFFNDDKIANFDGSGIDLTIALAKYF